MKRFVPLLLCCLSACSLAPDLKLPTLDIPSAWRHEAPVPVATATHRWEDFGSEELNKLIAAALSYNTDMQASLARIEQARASAVIAGSGLFPSIDASGSASQNRNYSNAGNTRSENKQAGIDISYELDLWARNRNLARAADYRLEAARYDREALTIVTSAEVARLYTGYLILNTRVDVATRNLESFRNVLRITDARYQSGAISGLEQSQQRTAVASAEASVASAINARDLFFNQLAVLTGKTPAQLHITATTMDGLRIPPLNLTDPWSLLTRRPDIASSEAALKAANIDIGVARANALPSVQLGLSGTAAFDPSSQAINLASSFFAPIFQGGALQADIDRSKAVRDEVIASYRGVLLTSFREVEDGLSNYSSAQTRLDALTVAAQESRRSYAITQAQYKSGSVDFQTLLDTQRSQLQSEDTELAARQALFAAAIDLIRALGGPLAPKTG